MKRLARFAVAVAARLLPNVEARLRYRAEFAAELHGRPGTAQLRQAIGILTTVLALRGALGASAPTDREAHMTTGRPRPFRCAVLHLHRWRMTSNPDGERYLACARCGEIHPGTNSTSSPLTPLMIGRAGGI
jgi:hypothetical protein